MWSKIAYFFILCMLVACNAPANRQTSEAVSRPVPPVVQDSEIIQDKLVSREQAEDLYSKGKFSQAAEIFEQLIMRNVSGKEIYHRLAYCYLRLAQESGGRVYIEKAYDRAFACAAGDMNSYELLAQIFYQWDIAPLASMYLRKITQKNTQLQSMEQNLVSRGQHDYTVVKKEKLASMDMTFYKSSQDRLVIVITDRDRVSLCYALRSEPKEGQNVYYLFCIMPLATSKIYKWDNEPSLSEVEQIMEQANIVYPHYKQGMEYFVAMQSFEPQTFCPRAAAEFEQVLSEMPDHLAPKKTWNFVKRYADKGGVMKIFILLFSCFACIAWTQEFYQLKSKQIKISDKVKPDLEAVAKEYHDLMKKGLVVTDGHRTAQIQAQQMYANLVKDENSISVYRNKKAASEIYKAYQEGADKEEKIQKMGEVIEKQMREGTYISKHLVESAVDLRTLDLSYGEVLLLESVARKHGFKLVYESYQTKKSVVCSQCDGTGLESYVTPEGRRAKKECTVCKGKKYLGNVEHLHLESITPPSQVLKLPEIKMHSDARSGTPLITQARHLEAQAEQEENSSVAQNQRAEELTKESEGKQREARDQSCPHHGTSLDGKIPCASCSSKGNIQCDDCNGKGKVTCPHCNGNKRRTCLVCGGTGRNRCRICDGKGTNACGKCGGSGSMTCPGCNGEGKVACGQCGGKGRITCSKCGGAGNQICPECCGGGKVAEIFMCSGCEEKKALHQLAEAAGQQSIEHLKMKTCYVCQGDGNIWCQKDFWCPAFDCVSGKVNCPRGCIFGKVTCTSCSRGQVTCSSCGGTGNDTCRSCSHGVITCPDCDSQGKVTCGKCNGYGKITCTSCNGKGSTDCSTCVRLMEQRRSLSREGDTLLENAESCSRKSGELKDDAQRCRSRADRLKQDSRALLSQKDKIKPILKKATEWTDEKLLEVLENRCSGLDAQIRNLEAKVQRTRQALESYQNKYLPGYMQSMEDWVNFDEKEQKEFKKKCVKEIREFIIDQLSSAIVSKMITPKILGQIRNDRKFIEKLRIYRKLAEKKYGKPSKLAKLIEIGTIGDIANWAQSVGSNALDMEEIDLETSLLFLNAITAYEKLNKIMPKTVYKKIAGLLSKTEIGGILHLDILQLEVKCTVAAIYAYSVGKVTEKRLDALSELNENALQNINILSIQYKSYVDELRELRKQKEMMESGRENLIQRITEY